MSDSRPGLSFLIIWVPYFQTVRSEPVQCLYLRLEHAMNMASFANCPAVSMDPFLGHSVQQIMLKLPVYINRLAQFLENIRSNCIKRHIFVSVSHWKTSFPAKEKCFLCKTTNIAREFGMTNAALRLDNFRSVFRVQARCIYLTNQREAHRKHDINCINRAVNRFSLSF